MCSVPAPGQAPEPERKSPATRTNQVRSRHKSTTRERKRSPPQVLAAIALPATLPASSDVPPPAFPRPNKVEKHRQPTQVHAPFAPAQASIEHGREDGEPRPR